MKQILLAVVCIVGLVACSGNPPAWWNPNNRYGTAQGQVQSGGTTKTPVVQDQPVDTFTDTFYEEEVIAPLPEEETSSLEIEDAENSSQAGVSTTQAEATQTGLPVPSVLE